MTNIFNLFISELHLPLCLSPDGDIPLLEVRLFCSQSYKASTIVNYDSRVVIWGIFKSGTTLES